MKGSIINGGVTVRRTSRGRGRGRGSGRWCGRGRGRVVLPLVERNGYPGDEGHLTMSINLRGALKT